MSVDRCCREPHELRQTVRRARRRACAFDDDEDYRIDQQLVDSGWSAVVGDAAGDDGISLQKLVVHEVGHVLGLLHNYIQHSIIYRIYISSSSPEDFELMREDRQTVQQIYGIYGLCMQISCTFHRFGHFRQNSSSPSFRLGLCSRVQMSAAYSSHLRRNSTMFPALHDKDMCL